MKENRLRVFTAFSGYDSQCMALERLGIPYDLVGWSEIDKYAIMAHDAVFPQWKGRNYGDISKIDWESVPDFDLFTYSFPCTDISNAGLQKGLTEGSGTRSGLLWECFRLMDVSEDDIDKIQRAGISNSQQYKLAGNSIVVSCILKILKQMFRPDSSSFVAKEKEKDLQLSLFD